ncbi:hypothetical protein LRS74_03700 [Streptomyces sp. LX-29]|uniref:prenyltransferase/squalene oxidase repeat-containing protein n=1 Tax=Streptomyces sp. LX-29 TaxID=2900152 RepID=UPI00240E7B37|nr:prenyltransferase/squalene oxidase repeat-containing protein [Streptomyces sp. LX-29]WFB06249.1 hypothetical protein LRS74_03700 [Streptomyces sp. LX-29]
MPLSTRLRTAAALPAAALVTALLLPGAAQADPAAPTGAGIGSPTGVGIGSPTGAGLTSPANAAATWMGSKLTDGAHAKGDHGLTADIVMGIAATGTGRATAAKATDWLADNAEAYVTRGTPGKVFAGGTAKLALVAVIEGRDPRKFGGVDLVATLSGRLQDNGRFTDDLPGGDMSNQFTQSLAILALQRTGGLPAKAVDFLAASRCADGGFPLFFKSDPAKCRSHTDSTGLAVQALLGAGRTADAKPALDWLEKQQLPDGGFGDNSFGAGTGNSNTTALDVQALVAGGRIEAAGKGIAWLRSRQLGCSAPAADRGAVGYLEPKIDGSELRATAQAVPALAAVSLAQVDGTKGADVLEPIACAPGGDTSGGTNGGTNGGGTDGGGTNGGGTDGGGTGGDSGGNGGGTSGSTDGGGDGSGTDAGTSGSTDPTPTPSPSDDSSGGTTGGGTTGGASGGTASTGGTGTGGTTGGGSGDATGGTGGGGSLADTGSAALPYAVGSAALLLTGATAVTLARARRDRG